MSLSIFCQDKSCELDQNATVKDLYNEIGYEYPLYFGGKRLDPKSNYLLADLGFSNEVTVEVGSLDCSLKGKQITQEMVDERNLDLSWYDLQDARLYKIKVSSLYRANLSNSFIEKCDFEGVNAESVNFTCAFIQCCEFDRANFQNANLAGVNLSNVRLLGANLESTYFKRAFLQVIKFNESILRNANLQFSDLRCANLQDTDLRGADLRDSIVGGASFKGADLRGANLQSVDFGWANTIDVDLRGAILKDTLFSSTI